MTDTQVLHAIQQLPDTLKQEVLHFIQTLLKKQKAEKEVASRVIPEFGRGKVNIKMSPDFDAPIDDFKDYM